MLKSWQIAAAVVGTVLGTAAATCFGLQAVQGPVQPQTHMNAVVKALERVAEREYQSKMRLVEALKQCREANDDER